MKKYVDLFQRMNLSGGFAHNLLAYKRACSGSVNFKKRYLLIRLIILRMKFSKEYICEKCEHQFHHIPVMGNMTELGVLVDPAPTYGTFLKSLFKRPACPKCKSSKVRKIV